jgi:hypothetical protein
MFRRSSPIEKSNIDRKLLQFDKSLKEKQYISENRSLNNMVSELKAMVEKLKQENQKCKKRNTIQRLEKEKVVAMLTSQTQLLRAEAQLSRAQKLQQVQKASTAQKLQQVQKASTAQKLQQTQKASTAQKLQQTQKALRAQRFQKEKTKELKAVIHNFIDYDTLFSNLESYVKKYNELIPETKMTTSNVKLKNFIQLYNFIYLHVMNDRYTDNIYVNKKEIHNLFDPKFYLNSNLIQQIVELKLYDDRNITSVWIKCEKECFNLWRRLIEKEIQSTVYMLRLIVKSILGNRGNRIVEFRTVNNEVKLTGKWVDDFPNLELFIVDPMERNKRKRTILGFGPSSSGKTYWAEEVVQLFGEDFPKVFLSIDGGIMREQSFVYQLIIKQNSLRSIVGFDNLVLAGVNLVSKSLFSSDEIKNSLLKFLKIQKVENRISLYVPETLGGCFFNCQEKYKKYIDLTGDSKSWIGLMIYQHLSNCVFPSGFQCTGTEKAGKSRQRQQGKKYSSSAYTNSIKNGREQLQKSPFCQLEIHNSGNKKNQSIIMEYPINNEYKLKKDERRKNFILLHGKTELKNFIQSMEKKSMD